MGSEFENPWRRMPWTLGMAVLVWLVLFWLFGKFLSHPERLHVDQKPVDAKLIEIPAPPDSAKPRSESPQKPDLPKPRAKVQEAPKKVEQPKVQPPPKAADQPKAEPQKGLPGGDEMGARAIYSPKPEIPEEYRQDALDALIVARFHVAADGTAKVELIIATPIPELNQAVLDTLSTWKFFPAVKDGKPIDSVQDVRFRLLVK
ncbi:MAG: TonB family protein [Burkholderiales bacterium]